MSEPQTVYVTIGNTDNELSQQEWSFYCAEVNHRIRNVASEIYGEFYSLPNAPYQNACWSIRLDESAFQQLQKDLEYSRKYWKQTSIAFAVARVKFIPGGET